MTCKHGVGKEEEWLAQRSFEDFKRLHTIVESQVRMVHIILMFVYIRTVCIVHKYRGSIRGFLLPFLYRLDQGLLLLPSCEMPTPKTHRSKISTAELWNSTCASSSYLTS